MASPNTIPPTTSSYWVVPGRLLAGAYPGDSEPEAYRVKVQALIDAGIRTFVNLMQVRQQDRERRQRMSPESPEQQRFVKGWLERERE